MRLQSIDVMRGLAALAVVLHHAGGGWQLGAIGVDFFFVISGFVMAHASQRKTATEFLRDRAWRIYPPYLILIGPMILYTYVMGGIGPARAFGSLLLWPHWVGIPADYYLVAWTLVYELAFYVAVAMAIRLKSPWLPLAIFAFALAVRPFTSNPLIVFAGSPIIVEFLFGMALAQLPRRQDCGLPLAVIGLLWLAAFPNAWLHDSHLAQSYGPGALRVLLWGIPAALIIYGALAYQKAPWPRFAIGLGSISYSLYLAHPMIAFQLALPAWAEAALALLAGFVAWYLVERPIMKWRTRGRWPGRLMMLPVDRPEATPARPAREALD